MTRTLPPGMAPAAGRFRYFAPTLGPVDLDISHCQFNLWKNMRADDPASTVALNIMIAARDHEVAIEDDIHSIAPALTVEWLDISTDQLTSRDRRALDGYQLDYREPHDDWVERPAALYEGSYGGTHLLTLALRFVAPDRYHLSATAEDEFDRRCEIEADLPLFTLGGSDFGPDPNPAVEAWLDRTFDRDTLDLEWQSKGSSDPWQVLHAQFKEI